MDTLPDDAPEKLAQMKERFPEQPEIVHKRYLIARQWDVDVAAQLLADFLEWRQSLGEVSLEGMEAELRMGAFHFHGVTKRGTPVAVILGRNLTPSKMTIEHLIKLNVYVIEKLLDYQPEVSKYTIIFDFRGFGLSNMSYSMLSQLIPVYNCYYPEVVDVEFFINVPWLFSGIWSWAKGYVDERTQKKIQILGSSWKSVLLEYIEPEELEECFGGTSTWKHEGYENATAENPMLGELGSRKELASKS